MQPLSAALPSDVTAITTIMSDLDDTITTDGRLPAASYASLEKLHERGLDIIIVTGRPAGWCDMIARFWPVTAVVGENGAFYFRYNSEEKTMQRCYQRTDERRRIDQTDLQAIFETARETYPQLRLSADQPYRTSDIGIDCCEDVSPLSDETVTDVMEIFAAHGANVKLSSIHINAWMGEFNKLEMSLSLLQQRLGISPDEAKRSVAYIGDSPNDEPMFEYFPLSVGVANIVPYLDRIEHKPRWITSRPGGDGFVELAERLISRP